MRRVITPLPLPPDASGRRAYGMLYVLFLLVGSAVGVFAAYALGIMLVFIGFGFAHGQTLTGVMLTLVAFPVAYVAFWMARLLGDTLDDLKETWPWW